VIKLGSPARAIIILAGAGAVAFAVSTAAVSSAAVHPSVPGVAVTYPFSAFSFTGGVSAPVPGAASFSLNFTTSFALNPNSPGIVNPATGTLDKVTVTERVSYPVPGGAPVGPAQLPFRSEKLALVVAISGKCFIPQPSGDYVFRGSLSCATPTLTLGTTSYSASSLLTSLTGTFTPPNPATGTGWTGSLNAGFANPGYTFPVATLGSGGGTTLTIGSNGGTQLTGNVTFSG
jgi:hypothetical protein